MLPLCISQMRLRPLNVFRLSSALSKATYNATRSTPNLLTSATGTPAVEGSSVESDTPETSSQCDLRDKLILGHWYKLPGERREKRMPCYPGIKVRRMHYGSAAEHNREMGLQDWEGRDRESHTGFHEGQQADVLSSRQEKLPHNPSKVIHVSLPEDYDPSTKCYAIAMGKEPTIYFQFCPGIYGKKFPNLEEAVKYMEENGFKVIIHKFGERPGNVEDGHAEGDDTGGSASTAPEGSAERAGE